MANRVDWESLWSTEARKKALPSLHGIVSRYTKEPDVIGMHGGLPPSNTFPFTSFHSGLLQLDDPAVAAAAAPAPAPAAAQDKANVQGTVMRIDDPLLVATAQQYNMHAQGYAPLVAWARDMVTSLHRPATLQQHSADPDQQQQQQQPQPQQHEAVGMDVVITPGASAALDSLVRVLVNPGDPVLVEEFTYAHMAESHLLPLGCELLPVPLDAGGLVPSQLDALLTARQAAGQPMPKLLYTIPTGQNPTGAVMDAERMAQVYSLARKWRLVIIEDDAYYWLQYPDGPDSVPGLNLRPGFLSLDVDGRVVRVDTLAKLLGPGFRLGWLSGPPPLVAKLCLYMAGISIGANMVSQVMLHELLDKTWGRAGFEAFVKRLQAQYARQAAVAQAAAQQQLAGLAEWQPARAGMFMWFKLTGDIDSECLIEAAAASKVMVVPGHLISVAHLQAAHKKKLALQQAAAQHQQPRLQVQDKEGGTASQLLEQLQGLTLQLQQQATQQQAQQQQQGGADDASSGVAGVAAQLATISQQLQRLRQLGVSRSSSPQSTMPAHVSADAGNSQAVSTPAVAAAVAGGDGHVPCPYFRVSYVSVPAEAIEEGFVRLRAAILSCHGPKTPPGEESELASCSSSIGSSGSNAVAAAGAHGAAVMPAAAAAAAGGDSALC